MRQNQGLRFHAYERLYSDFFFPFFLKEVFLFHVIGALNHTSSETESWSLFLSLMFIAFISEQ